MLVEVKIRLNSNLIFIAFQLFILFIQVRKDLETIYKMIELVCERNYCYKRTRHNLFQENIYVLIILYVPQV